MTIADISSFSTIIIASTTIIYTIGTFLLWIETRKSYKHSREELKITQKRLKADLIANMVSWNRDLFSYILSKDNFIELIAKQDNISKDKLQRSLLASLMINNALQTYYHYRQGNLDEEIWLMVEKDIKELFGWSFILERWEETKDLYFNEFRNFIEEKYLKNKQ